MWGGPRRVATVRPRGQPRSLAQDHRGPATLGPGVGCEAAGFDPSPPSCALLPLAGWSGIVVSPGGLLGRVFGLFLLHKGRASGAWCRNAHPLSCPRHQSWAGCVVGQLCAWEPRPQVPCLGPVTCWDTPTEALGCPRFIPNLGGVGRARGSEQAQWAVGCSPRQVALPSTDLALKPLESLRGPRPEQMVLCQWAALTREKV